MTVNNPPPRDPLLVDFKTVCQLLSISRQHFFNLRDRGEFPIRPIRLGRSVRYDRRQVERWIENGCRPDRRAGR